MSLTWSQESTKTLLNWSEMGYVNIQVLYWTGVVKSSVCFASNYYSVSYKYGARGFLLQSS